MDFSNQQQGQDSTPTQKAETNIDEAPEITDEQQQQAKQAPLMLPQQYEQQQQQKQEEETKTQEVQQQQIDRPDPSKRIQNPFVLDEHSEIVISVGEPITKESTLSKHTSYNVKGQDKLGQFDVYRRFSEFYALKEVLSARWPGCFIPSIPAKEMNSTSQNVVENRQRFLNSFCNQLAKLPHLFYSEEFQLFLRQKDSDVTKQLTAMKKVSITEIIGKLTTSFPELSPQSINSDFELKINAWSIFLKKSINGLKNFKEQLKTLTSFRKELNRSFSQFNHEILPEYEKCLISQYVQNDPNSLVICNPNNTQTAEFLQRFDVSEEKNSFQNLYDMVKFELRDAEAFEESIKEKENLEKLRYSLNRGIKDDQEDLNKLQSGGKTVKSILSSSDSQIKKKIQKIEQQEQELKSVNQLIDIITKIITLIEIDRFKKEKKQTYFRVLTSVSDSEISNSLDLQEYWSNINDHSTRLLPPSK